MPHSWKGPSLSAGLGIGLSAFSLSGLPVGLGLTAAAHVHLCRQTLLWTEPERQLCLMHQSFSQLEYFTQLLSDLNSFSEMVELINTILTRFPERPRSSLRRRPNVRRIKSHREKGKDKDKDKGKDEGKGKEREGKVVEISDSKRSNIGDGKQHQNHTTTSINVGSPEHLSKDIESSVKQIATAASGMLHSSADAHTTNSTATATKAIRQPDDSSSGSKRNRGQHRHSRHSPQESFQSLSRKSTSLISGPFNEISIEDMELWAKSYKALRESQESYMKKAFKWMKQTDPFYLKLQNHVIFSLLLSSITVLHYVVTMDRFRKFIARCVEPFHRLGSWVGWGSVSPFHYSYIPWGLAPSTGAGPLAAAASMEQVTGALISSSYAGKTSGPTPSTDTGMGTTPRSKFYAAFAFLPLAPTIFVSGIHFLTAARTHLVIRKMHQENQRQAQFSRRLNVVSTFFLIREQRLLWLAQEIREFEQREAEAEAKSRQEEEEQVEEYESEDGLEGRHIVAEELKACVDAEGSTATAAASGLTTGATAGVGLSTGEPSRARTMALAKASRRKMYAMLSGSGVLDNYRHSSSQEQPSLGGNQSSGVGRNVSNTETGRDESLPRQSQGQGTSQSPSQSRSLDQEAMNAAKRFPFTFGPDLETMDLQLFLREPQERRRILRLEFEGMRDELTLFRRTLMTARF